MIPTEQIADSGPLLETCAGAGATLVAIVGGLLVTRYITLESELQAAQDRLTGAEGRLSEAVKNLESATLSLTHFRIETEVDQDEVIDELLGAASEDRTVDLNQLRRLTNLDPWTYPDEQVIPVLEEWSYEALKTRAARPGLWDEIPESLRHETWWDFKRARHLPIAVERVWSRRYDIQCEAQTRAAANGRVVPNALLVPKPTRYPDRRDAESRLIRLQDNARSACDSLRVEVAAARQARSAISRPPGLALGLVVLALLTLATVVVPVLYLAPTPATLTYRHAAVVVATFLAAIVVLFGYMIWHVYRLRKLGGQQSAEIPPSSPV